MRPAPARPGDGVAAIATPALVIDLDALERNIARMAAFARERGLRLLYDAPKRGTSNSRVNFIHPKDAGGILVELVEPSAGH